MRAKIEELGDERSWQMSGGCVFVCVRWRWTSSKNKSEVSFFVTIVVVEVVVVVVVELLAVVDVVFVDV